ncbi:hypothetical protein DRO64_02730 [Candidatus Bathyarchaeota archaeon]|nr:MAG: hypothetical protein DRO64_02730 [Candidatus Bathyarchaeota archaeon]
MKPNLVDRRDPKTGETVHPKVKKVLIRLAFHAGAGRVIVEEGAEMINFDEHPFVKVRVKNPV